MTVTRPLLLLLGLLAIIASPSFGQERSEKPPLHAQHWLAITGKPLGATAGARMFERGGNAVDAACAMVAATATLWDTLHWGGETQALIWHPGLRKVIAINALGVAPTGATVEFFREKGMRYPPAYGPLAAVTPGTPGGILVMLAEYGRLSLAEVLGPAIELADGFPIEAQLANAIERDKAKLKEWPNTARIMLPHLGLGADRGGREGPRAGRSSVSLSSQRHCASWSRPNGAPSPAAPRVSRRYSRLTSASIGVISQPNSLLRCRLKVD